MTRRGKRWLAGVSATVVAVAGLLAGLEWDRRRHLSAGGDDVLAAPAKALSSEELLARYRDPAEFTRLCATVRERSMALRARFLRLRYTRRGRLTEFDRQGAPYSVTAFVEHVWFEGETERKEEIEGRQVLGPPPGHIAETLRAGQLNGKAVAPFSQGALEGVYGYELEGVEEIDGRPVVCIRCRPLGSAEGKLRGRAWVDPATGEPVRFHGEAASPPRFVDRIEMRADYGLSENGYVQVRRLNIDCAGGFAFLSSHVRLESELGDYRD
jgi:hypothetical protein